MINVTTDLTGAYHCYAVNSEDNRKKSVIHWLEVQRKLCYIYFINNYVYININCY